MPQISLLVADDESVVRSYVRAVIEEEALPVARLLEAADGWEALEECRLQKPDAVLMDLKMPNLDGLSAIAVILKELPDTYVSVVSAYDDFNLVRQAFVLGARDYLLKPAGARELARQVRKMAAALEPAAAGDGSEKLLQGALDYIDQYMAEPFRTADLAKSLYLSPAHLGRKIKKLTGRPLGDLIRKRRLTRAREFLAHPALSVSEVAALVGFENPGYFATFFKSQTGLTPGDFRRETGKSSDSEPGPCR
ncbi:MAG: response regulator [Candidatus Adiutrix sp.]|jgi:YesN/AraC family two-component response regulator|nr:response regulator [Candidatus Adiutrix sp.]